MNILMATRRLLLASAALVLVSVGTSRAADLVPYQATGWSYHQVSPGDPLESQFQDPNFDDSGWAVGQAAFGGSGYGCPLEATLHTGWATNTHMLLRRTVFADPLAPVVLHLAIDNDANVWFNGTQVLSVTHEGCASLDSYNVTVPSSLVNAGMNVVAIQAIDRGVVAFFDMRIEGDAPVPTRGRSWGAVKTIYR